MFIAARRSSPTHPRRVLPHAASRVRLGPAVSSSGVPLPGGTCPGSARYRSGNALAATHDHVLFNVGTRRQDGSYSWGSTQVALRPRLEPGDAQHHPATPSWAAYHICDPDVIKGRFTYTAPGAGAKTYTWAMFFTGADDDDHGAECARSTSATPARRCSARGASSPPRG
ncbi:hypothetical protein AB0K18_30660 [Nonomuraea sp. NPDC049421]|uniref:hypothetical protein n=1 Tax=Nonomuraea sp. NPDC049421 TaxID=3155275 RepID=UPI003412F504